ncbi:kinesin-like nuclear fusion protein [Neopestalotiopsis sp. 37M]|nr:kinesin-like nuclear fusion protein [Neopestalotiopsis sp. 37M]
MDTETSINKPSGLPRLGASTTSRLPQLHSSSAMSHHGLHEITESQTNTRSQSAMAPPSLTGIKRGLQPPVSQSEPKRKTLAEKAATEFPQATTKSGLVAPTPVRSTIKGTSLRDMQSTRPVTRSVASYNSNTSRNTSTSSYASSIGPGARPPSRTAHARSASVRSTATRSNRSATSMGVRAEEPTKNGTKFQQPLAKKPNTSSKVPITSKKVRKYHSVNDMSIAYAQSLPPAREASICRALDTFSISEGSAISHTAQDPVDSRQKTPSPIFKVPTSVARRNHLRVDTSASPVREVRRDIPVVPKTPTSKDLMQQFARVNSSYKTVTPLMSPSPTKASFLTKGSNLHNFVAWDVDERLGTFESEVKAMKEMISNSINGRMSSESELAAEKQKVAELEQTRNTLESSKSELQSKLEDANNKIYSLTRELDDEKRARRNDAEDLEREHRNDIDNRLRQFNREKDELDRISHQKLEKLKEELAADFAKQLGEAHQAFEELEKLLEEEKRSAVLRSQANGKDLEAQFVQIAQMKKEKEELVEAQRELKGLVAIREARIADLEKAVTSGQAALIHLKSDEQKQVEHFRIIREEKQVAVEQAAKAEQQAEEYKTKLRVEERRRRKLFDQLQTLKGNIRVMCRIRPGRDDSGNAQIQTDVGEYDDHIGKMTLMVPIKKYDGEQLVDRSYDFERVFEQQEGNKVVFEEISQLVQSALDGQKVCVFAYGQTGSGKTFTMSAQQDSIIPSAMKMIYEQAESMKDAGWTYEMWGSFTEVYNEKLFDLLSDDGSRNEVQLRQDPTTKKYYVESRASKLGSPAEVETMLATANKNRTVAATNMNRASSRSHCVFTLKLEGVDIDGNRSEGVLNLIDLAGSERVKESQVEGQNFKEAASINTSLSTLSKVMTALAENASHIPYRESSLTKLLEGCLGGNAKALMFVMVSPLAVDIKETVSSLDFATTVSKAKPGQQGGPLKAIKTGRSIKKR